jgi:type I restriction enzyme R subunit
MASPQIMFEQAFKNIDDLINQYTTRTDPNYCHRVTTEDGELGEQYLRAFQDNERTIFRRS